MKSIHNSIPSTKNINISVLSLITHITILTSIPTSIYNIIPSKIETVLLTTIQIKIPNLFPKSALILKIQLQFPQIQLNYNFKNVSTIKISITIPTINQTKIIPNTTTNQVISTEK